MDFNIKKRQKLYSSFDINDINLKKISILGKGANGVVYKFCKVSNIGKVTKICTAVKSFNLTKDDIKFLKDPFNKKAYNIISDIENPGNYIELTSNILTNELILQNICPNFILHYDYDYDINNKCTKKTSCIISHYNEYIDKVTSYREWISQEHSLNEFYNAYFQILVALYSMKKYFNMHHLDLQNPDNILVKKIKKGGYWTFIINDKKYFLPNLGYIFLLNDFGMAWIPDNFYSWFIKKKYKTEEVYNGFDIQELFNNTFKISKSPPKFKKQIRYIIKQLYEYSFEEIIEEIYYNKYIKAPNDSVKIDEFDLSKKLNTKYLPKELIRLVK